MGGFILANTLSENGTVTRGVCEVGEDGILRQVRETYNIRRTAEGMQATDKNGVPVNVRENQPVSMNMWGLTPAFVKELEKGFPEFLSQLEPGDMKSEYLLPSIIDQMIREKRARVTDVYKRQMVPIPRSPARVPNKAKHLASHFQPLPIPFSI